MEWKDLPITKAVYRKLLTEKVVPAIMQKWPRSEWNDKRRIIRIQQDGPNTHIDPEDDEWNQSLEELGVADKILLYTQPANSPDLNINDLGFFRALQSAYLEFSPEGPEDIIKYVNRAYEEFPTDKINFIWLTLQSCMNEIISCHGDNSYKVPHLGKEKLQRAGSLPVSLLVTEDVDNWLT